MKVSKNWIAEYTKLELPVDKLVEKIGSQLGEIEEVIDLGKKYKGIKVVKVVECIKHPNADKLSLCQIDTGKKNVQVVCGAPNVRAGLLAVWIPPGNAVPATIDKDPFTLEARKIRGETSNGMLASASELAIGDDHSGIVELKKGKPGDDFAKTYGLDDHIIDIENKMFTHRPDCFGLLGVAREVAGINHKSFASPEWYLKTPNFKQKTGLDLSAKNNAGDLVPRFMAVAMGNVEIKPSSFEIQAKLASVGLKPINNIVDITNYLMYLTGQPLHAYDYDKLLRVSGKDGASLETRMSKKGDKLKLLGGKKVLFDDDSVVLITSGDKPVGIGGVMGGADTEVDETTKNIVLECANFDLYSIRRTSMKFGLFTDAVTRFSKGQSPLQNDRIIARAMDMVAKEAGGVQSSKVIDEKARMKPRKSQLVDANFINARLGLSLGSKEIIKLLKNVEFDVYESGKSISINPPFWRTDITIDEDIVEEVGRLYGYDHLPLELPKRTSAPARISSILSLKQELARELSATGANEVLTYSFVHEKLFKDVGQSSTEAYRITNALSPGLQYYRLSLTPSLLEKVHPNIKAGIDKFMIFELGKVHGKSQADEKGLPKEMERLALVFADKSKSGGAAYYDAARELNSILSSRFSGLMNLPLSESKIKGHKMFAEMIAPYEPSRSALVYSHEKLLGVVGEFKQSVINRLKLPIKTAGFEIFLTPLIGQKLPSYTAISKYPGITQDMTVQTEQKLEFAKLNETLISSLNDRLPDDAIENVHCMDIYARDDKSKNTTFRINVFSYQRTLTTELLSSVLDKVAGDLEKSVGARRV